jgi:hypothetical protein
MAGRVNIPDKIRTLLDSALDLFRQLARPKGLLQELPLSDFQSIYDGSGLNLPEGPVPMIVPRADGLALFAATLGSTLVSKSSDLFANGGPALGFMLDAVNSSAAERLGKRMGLKFIQTLPEEKQNASELKAQYYCPGHCGWHMSGQTKLFQVLCPEEIGITLNERWVMQPVKSISGILVAGEMDIHRFKPAFSFCNQCKEHKCVKRLLLLESEN